MTEATSDPNAMAAQLRESERRLALFVHENPLAYIEIDAALRITTWNPAAQTTFGYSAAEALGQAIDTLLFPPDQEAGGLSLFRRASAGMRSSVVNVTRAGARIVCEWVCTPLKDDQEVLIGVAILAQDVTERRRNEEVIRSSEERYRLLAENATDLIARHNVQGVCLYASPSCRALLGYEPQDLLGRTSEYFCHPDDLAAVRAACMEVAATGATPTLSYRLRHKDGRWVWVECTYKAVVDAATGEVRETIRVLRDISERKQAELLLEQNNRLLRALTQLQRKFIQNADLQGLFDDMLQESLSLTGSAYGFIGEVLHTDGGKPYLKTHAISNSAWNPETRLLDDLQSAGGLDFFNLQTLFGAVLQTGAVVVSNAPAEDPRRGGLPQEHPPLRAFLGLPLHQNEQLVGMIGLANRAEGYDETVAGWLEPMRTTCAAMIVAARNERSRRDIEEALRVSETRLRESHQLLRTIIDSFPGLISARDDQLRFLVMNRAQAAAFGTTPDDARGKSVSDLINREYGTLAETRDRYVMSNAMPLRFEESAPDAFGRLRDWFTTTAPLPVSDGDAPATPRGVVSVSVDISDRRRAEQALRQSTDRFRTLVEQSFDLIVVFDAHGRINYVTPSVQHVLGYSSEEFLRLNALELIHANEQKLAGSSLAALWQRERSSVQIEFRVQHRDGSWHWVEAILRNLSDVSGIGGIVLNARDVTQRKVIEEELWFANAEMEQRVLERTAELTAAHATQEREIAERKKIELALRASEERFRAIADYTYDWESWIDAAGEVVWVNPAVERLTGYSVAECMAMPDYPLPLIEGEDRPALATELWGALAGSTGNDFQFRIRRKDGSVTWGAMSWQPLLGEAGKRLGYRSSVRDVSARVRAEEQLRQLHSELTHVSRLSTMGELAAGLAHELNQPLAAIANYGKAALNRFQAGPAQLAKGVALVEQIVQQVDHAGKLIRRLRAFLSRGEPHHSILNLQATIQDAVRLAEVELRRLGTEVHVEEFSDLAIVQVDRTQIVQVMLNLLRNAGEAMQQVPAEQRIITVAVKQTSPTVVEVSVRDEGCGIAPSLAEVLFQPFQTTKSHGMGMGLAISRRIVEAHGGRLWVESHVGRGATFFFTLPSR